MPQEAIKLADWQERVVEEHKELQLRIRALTHMLDSSVSTVQIDAVEKESLRCQLQVMMVYKGILFRRMARWHT